MSKYYSQTNPQWTGVQVGTIAMMPKDSSGNYYAPAGWQECNGRSLNPNEFLALYQIIGNTYGGNAGSESAYPSITGSFNVPDLRDRRAIGTGRIRPEDASSPDLSTAHDSGDSDTCGTKGGQNVLRLPDVAPRVQVIGTPNINYNTSRTAQSGVSLNGGNISVTTGALSNHTAGTYPNHQHGNARATVSAGGVHDIDRTDPGSGDTGWKINPAGGPSYGPWPTQTGNQQPHSHWISFKTGITGTVSYHRGWGDSIGIRGQNTHLGPESAAYGFNGWYDQYCVNADLTNEGRIDINNGKCTITPAHTQISAYMQPQSVDATQCSFQVGITLGLDTDPDIKPTFQETAYMIFLGVSSTAYVAPPPPVDTGDNIPDAFGPLSVSTTTQSGTPSVSFTLSGCDAVYEFTVIVTKTGGADVGSTPINLGGTGTNTKSGYRVGDNVSMTLEGPASGGAEATYTISIYSDTVLVQSGTATVTYAAAPDITISAAPDTVQPGGSSTITFSAPGATTIVSSTFGATIPTGESISVTPPSGDAITYYYITVSNAYGQSTANTSVSVDIPSAPVINLTAYPSEITIGGTAVVTYNSYNSDTFDSSNIPGVNSPIYGQADVTPTVDTTYYVTLSNAYGTTTEEVEVTVQPLPLPTVDFSQSTGLNINVGDETGAYIRVDVDGATSIVYSSNPADSDWDSQTNLTGFSTGKSPSETTTYTVAATNSTGTTTESVTVTVTQLPTVTLSSNPSVLEIGTGATNPVSQSTLTWSSTDATTVVSSNFGASAVSGTTTVSPTETTVYDITVSGPAGQGQNSTTVTVNCTPGTGTTAGGYANTIYGYLRMNDGTEIMQDYYVTSTISSWHTQIAKGTTTYLQVFNQILTSYANILDRKPDDFGFDYWVDEFVNDNIVTLSDLNTSISNSANGIGVGASNEIALRAPYGGLEGNYDECGTAIFP